MYFDIFKTATHIEYHVSADRSEVRNRQSMSRRIPWDHPQSGSKVLEWLNDADMYKCIRVHSIAPVKMEATIKI